MLAVASSACAANSSDDLVKRYPWLKFASSITPSPINGLYEVTLGLNVIYLDPVSGYRIYGHLFTPFGSDSTAESILKAQRAAYDNIKKHLPDAIKIGSGQNEVIEIIDPDCPFCRRMGEYWKNRTDVTRYVFLMPLTQLHPQAQAHTDYILSVKDSAEALGEVEAGKYDKATLPTTVLNDTRIKAQAASLISGINSAPAYFVNGNFINGANVPLIEKHLKGEKP